VGSVLFMQFAWHSSATRQGADALPSEKVNLALRRTAHHLLLAAGDSSSYIPPVEQTGPNTWLVRLERPFRYADLPGILQASLDLHGITTPYDAALLRCMDGALLLGYNAEDYAADPNVPCGTRELPSDCHNLQITLGQAPGTHAQFPLAGWFFSAALAAILYALNAKRPRQAANAPPQSATTGWLSFGDSRFEPAQQRLHSGGQTHKLTYREAKLLQLFVEHPNQVLERGFILNQVWADEGVLVGRSVDMFVSRLRKFLRDDPSVSLVAVHGVGYRMELA
jgi:hypothetical protein